MTAEIDLLPLPEMGHFEQRYDGIPYQVRTAYTAGQMHAYARANVAVATAMLQAEIERLRKLLDRMVVCNQDGSVGIRVTEDALNAAAELYRLFGDAKKEADRG